MRSVQGTRPRFSVSGLHVYADRRLYGRVLPPPIRSIASPKEKKR
jgi:hypothetical protein